MKIMAALDLSDYADFVLTKAIKTAKQQNAKLDIVTVVEVQNDSSGTIELQQTIDNLIDEATQVALSYQKKAIKHGVAKVKVRILKGNSAAEEIIKYQKAENLDLIVIGRRSCECSGNPPIGTVAQRVAAFATCTVMVVRCRDKQ